jgi:hypothetical protein
MTSPGEVDADPPIRHMTESLCVTPGCLWVAELGEAWCFLHGGGQWVEDLREADR